VIPSDHIRKHRRRNAVSDNRYVPTLERAVELAGGRQQLAELLHTCPEMLGKWLSGQLHPPVGKYLAALQLVMSQVKAPVARSRA
jgi:hypothetical protein